MKGRMDERKKAWKNVEGQGGGGGGLMEKRKGAWRVGGRWSKEGKEDREDGGKAGMRWRRWKKGREKWRKRWDE